MAPKKEYVKPEIVMFDLNVEPLNAACCNTSNLYAFVTAGKIPPCSASCCPKIVTSR